ncbi:Non-catalytic module family DOC2 [Piromyces sp. E2]|nr:Non-catalytic module family DOC2 [Piromyces sp. E2]|eukprot:OUM64394.1 Non-catalytic module family DOC2 [Piromyces sp. E2]
MKSSKIISVVFALALTGIVSTQNLCSSKITNKGYKCCSTNCTPTFTDEDGEWTVENGEWCGCTSSSNTPNNDDNVKYISKCSMKITNKGYSCCPIDCEVIYTDDDGTWGLDNNEWCGCSPDDSASLIDKYNQRIKDIMADGQEIEKKWLIDTERIPYKLRGETVTIQHIKQTYICFDPEIRVREYSGRFRKYEMTIKTNLSKDGVVRDEVNIDIDYEQYENLIAKQEGNTIYKTRYQFYADGEVIAINIFEEDLEGLAYMEIEFPSKAESDAYQTPDWVIKDVTDDIRYKNGHLARYGIPNPQ